MERITSRQNAIVARFRAAARGDDDRMLLDGIHLVGDAHRAGVMLDVVALTAEAGGRPEIAALIPKLGRVDVVEVTGPVLDAMSPVRAASGIVALARRPRASASACFSGSVPMVLVAADIQDPGNLGAIVRVAEAGGASGVLTTNASADPFGWKALRGSMGSALRLPVARVASVEAALDEARAHGCTIVATTPSGGRPFTEARLAGALAILIGGEGAGLPRWVVDAADERVSIPMQPPVESLNAAVSAALLVYEARRQRDDERRSPARTHTREERGSAAR